MCAAEQLRLPVLLVYLLLPSLSCAPDSRMFDAVPGSSIHAFTCRMLNSTSTSCAAVTVAAASCSFDHGSTLGEPLSMSLLNSNLNGLTPKLKHSLRGLTISGGFRWCKTTLDCIASITGLSSLQLLQIKGDGANSMQIDLSALAKLKQIRKFSMQFPQEPLLQVKFTVEQQEGGSSSSGSNRRYSGGGKRGKKQQKVGGCGEL
jgi:hypothetical protein